MGFQSAFGSGTEGYFAEDHQMPQRLFRKIIRGWHAGMPEESKEKLLFGTCEIAPEGLGGFETKGWFADIAQFRDGAFFDLGRRLPGDIAGFELLSRVAELGAEIDDAVAEEADSSVLLGLGQERMFGADLLGVCEEMGEADLPVRSDPVIGGIPVAHQRSVKVLPEDAFRHLGRPMSIDMKEGEIFIAGEPYRMPHAVITPGSFIAMDHVGGPDLLAQILIERFPLRCRFAVEPQGGGRNSM